MKNRFVCLTVLLFVLLSIPIFAADFKDIDFSQSVFLTDLGCIWDVNAAPFTYEEKKFGNDARIINIVIGNSAIYCDAKGVTITLPAALKSTLVKTPEYRVSGPAVIKYLAWVDDHYETIVIPASYYFDATLSGVIGIRPAHGYFTNDTMPAWLSVGVELSLTYRTD